MANPSATVVSYSINLGKYEQDGYVNVGNDGITQVSTLPVTSVISSFSHVSTGVWQCTLKDTWPKATNTNTGPLLRFVVVPVYTTDPGASFLTVALLSNNLNTNTVAGQGVINFEFLNSSGTQTDLPPDGGFMFSIALTNADPYM